MAIDDFISELRAQIDRLEGFSKPYLDTDEAAAFTGFSSQYLFDARKTGHGPPFILIPPRSIRYKRDDLAKWLDKHRVQP